MTTPTDPAGKSYKEKAVDWLFNQAASTVLLAGILFGGGYSIVNLVPEHLKAIQSGYDRNSADLKEVVKEIRDTSREYSEATDKLTDRVDDLTKRVDRLVEREFAK